MAPDLKTGGITARELPAYSGEKRVWQKEKNNRSLEMLSPFKLTLSLIGKSGIKTCANFYDEYG